MDTTDSPAEAPQRNAAGKGALWILVKGLHLVKLLAWFILALVFLKRIPRAFWRDVHRFFFGGATPPTS